MCPLHHSSSRRLISSQTAVSFSSSQTAASFRRSFRQFQSDGHFVGSSQTVGELVTVNDGLAALEFLTAPNSCPSAVAPDGV